jgi:small subunit ribosomal protein S10
MPQETKKKETKKSPKVAKKAAIETPERLRIKVQAYEYKILDNSVRQIIDTAVRYDAKVRGPIPLPTDTKKYTVNRSSFIFKDAREQYEMRTHRRLIDILEPSGKVIEALTNLSLPSGISIDVKMI